jgi:hypothetical protein
MAARLREQASGIDSKLLGSADVAGRLGQGRCVDDDSPPKKNHGIVEPGQPLRRPGRHS